MNKTKKIRYIKSEIRDLENQERLFEQCLSGITSRKTYLMQELDSLGASGSRPRANVLTDKQRNDLIGNLTK